MSPVARVDHGRNGAVAANDDVIHIRASAEMKAILDRAAMLRGQKLSDFMLDSARARAEETLVYQRIFSLEPEPGGRFRRA